MKVAIIGSSGYIGDYLYERLTESEKVERILRIGRGNEADYRLDLVCPESFDYSVLKSIDYIIFTAAISSPDRCTREYDICWKINVESTKYFIQNVTNMGCRVLFLSSDAVFGDIPGKIYSEDEKTIPKTPYGKMKKVIEDEFKNNSLFKAIRLSYVVSVRDRFVSYCLDCLQKERVAEIFHPFYRNCITITDVGNIITWLLQNWDEFPHNILNAAGEELISRVRIADEINRVVDGRLKYMIVSPDKSFFLNRPEITQMVSKYMYIYNINNRKTFTQKFQSELEGYKCR